MEQIETLESKKILNSLKEIKEIQKIIYVFGSAGTGKSTLIKRIRKLKINSVVLAPTGIAALNVDGQTIHSFFKFDFSPSPNIKKPLNSALIKKLDLLIIDEVSMLNPAILDSIDKTLKKTRETSEPFGGVSVMFVGDMFQLEPVVTGDTKKFFINEYGSTFFFEAKCLWNINPEVFELNHKFRHAHDKKYSKLLDSIRLGENLNECLTIINKLCMNNFEESNSQMILTGNNLSADIKNEERLKAIPSKSIFYDAYLTGDFKYKKDKEESLPAPLRLELKKGAQVRMVKNSKGKWANGSLGKIVNLEENFVEVKIGKIVYEVERESWEIINYVYDEEREEIIKEVKGQFNQLPMRLGWASTIHKSQGLSLSSCTIDLDSAFCHGQAYVALSRCSTLDGINLIHPLEVSDIIINERVKNFYINTISDTKLEAVS
ncbi:AAA family ATPase [SAR86 cluster bacterium]|nr:AAA family ATPase [SAR86 cluster bacterium]